jgi:nitrate reductase molybdenum cofactor assembly chaperone NarJ/NarW
MPIYGLFADILDYPERSIAKSLGDCIGELTPAIPEAHAHLKGFQNSIADKSLGQLQEVYTNAFDLRPDCTPNLGYHLFGDDGRRGLFLAELKGRMESRGIRLGVELPDHIALLLRYLDAADEEERLPVIEDCLLPAVARMVEVLKPSGNPYEHALSALLSLIRHQHEGFTMSAETVEPSIAHERAIAFNILE